MHFRLLPTTIHMVAGPRSPKRDRRMCAKRFHIVQLSLRNHLYSPARIRTGVPIRPRLTNARPGVRQIDPAHERVHDVLKRAYLRDILDQDIADDFAAWRRQQYQAAGHRGRRGAPEASCWQSVVDARARVRSSFLRRSCARCEKYRKLQPRENKSLRRTISFAWSCRWP